MATNLMRQIIRQLQVYAGVPASEVQALAQGLDELEPFATEVELLATDLPDGHSAYAQDTDEFFFRRSGSWETSPNSAIAVGSADMIQDADNDTRVETEASADEDIIRMFAQGAELMTIEGPAKTYSLGGGTLLGDVSAGASNIIGANASATATGANRIGGDVRIFGGIETPASGVGDGNTVLAYNGTSQVGQVLLPSGSIAAPALAFVSDSNTGIQRVAADQMRLVAGGWETFLLAKTSIKISTNNATRWTFTSGGSLVSSAGGATVAWALPNATNPGFIPRGGDAQTGYGWSATGNLALTTSGVHRVGVNSARVNLGVSPAVGTDPIATTLADFFDYVSKDILVAVGGSAVASVDVGFDLPADAMVMGAAMNIQTAITGAGGATAIGLGIAATEDKYGETSTLTLDSKSTASIGGMVALASSEDIKVFATNGAGAPTGTIQNGSVRIRIVYATMTALPNA